MKKGVVNQDTEKVISQIKFQIQSPSEIYQYSAAKVTNYELYDPGQVTEPCKNGILDKRMGPNNKNLVCQTCEQKLSVCPGHFGCIELPLPIFHPGYFTHCVKVLQMVCKSCSRVMLNQEQRAKYRRMLNQSEFYIHRSTVKAIHAQAEKCSQCTFCHAMNYKVKKTGFLKVGHAKYNTLTTQEKKQQIPCNQEFYDSMQLAVKQNPSITHTVLGNAVQDINPSTALNILKNIPDEDVIFLGMKGSRPEHMILTMVPVMPNTIRPSAPALGDKGTNEDDITVGLSRLISVKNVIATENDNKTMPQLMDLWQWMQCDYSLVINGMISGLPKNCKPKGKPPRGLVQRLKGKQGRFRGNLSGKRVNFSGRTVISPDPNLQIDQVGIPIHIAKIMTYPERVNKYNIDLMRQLVINGLEYPGANFVSQGGKDPRWLKYVKDRKAFAKNLRYGDVVQRHMMDDDVVLFNRQPSLHRISIMAHFAKIGDHRTFRFNECVCNPYNADFDGDEMNIHLPQTEEAKAEACLLMGTKNNICTPRSGEPLIAAIQDFITAAYLLTKKDVFFNRFEVNRLTNSMLAWKQANMRIDLPPPAICYPTELWTGKQVFGLILRPNLDSNVKICLEARGKQNEKPTFCNIKSKEFCPNDSWVIIQNSELIAGHMDKNTLGGGSKNNIFYILLVDYSQTQAAEAMWRMAKVCPAYLSNRGFSIGIGDVTPTNNLLSNKTSILNDGYSKCDEYMDLKAQNKLQSAPGCTVAETLEARMLSTLSGLRDMAGDACKRTLSYLNIPLNMAMCGSKGSLINISQMIALVGQQAINGNRVPHNFDNRPLPHFPVDCVSPKAGGFVSNSFYSGLTSSEFFFHTQGGREGLVDTAVKTAETGYLQRRLIKALEDLCVKYDMTVRSSNNDIVQFLYGNDALDPLMMEGSSTPVELDRVMKCIKINHPAPDECRLSVAQIMSHTDRVFKNTEETKTFYPDVKDYLLACGEALEYQHDPYIPFTSRGNLLTQQIGRLTKTQLEKFLNKITSKYKRSVIEPGTAVGALCAQSIGEPGTQMTLKTFHFAGVASMNITQGVPRIKEIINASSTISTPIITSYTEEYKEEAAIAVKGRLEKTVLYTIIQQIAEIQMGARYLYMIELNEVIIKLLKLPQINVHLLHDRLICAKLPISPTQINIMSKNIIGIEVDDNNKHSMFRVMQILRNTIRSIVVTGLDKISRVVVKENKEKQEFQLVIEGQDLLGVMACRGTNARRTKSNDVLQVEKVLGIEAARTTIINEVQTTMGHHGMQIDKRHLMLLADVMTYKGKVYGITRFGLEKVKESSLMLASFEKTADHLFDASFFGQCEKIDGVSECIITGVPMKVGTGVFDLMYSKRPDSQTFKQTEFLFDRPEYHKRIKIRS